MSEAKASLKNRTIKGMFWGGVDTFLNKGISFVFNLLIARQLMPEDYGVIAILAVLMSICQCFVDSGFGAALVRKSNRTEEDFSTVFYFNILAALVLYIIIWLIAPFIARFYNQPILTEVTKIYSVVLIINALSIVQNTKLTIDLNFKAFAKISAVAAILTGTIALFLAYRGYGIWALVVQAISNALIRSILLWIASKWRPKLLWSWLSFKDFFSFGSKLLCSSLINTLYNSIYTLVIGKVYSPSSLGAYSKGDSIAKFPSEAVTGVLGNVSFPALSSIKDDERHCLNSCRQIVRMSSFIIFPMMMGLAAIADPFIRLCLTDKWEEAIPFMQLLCFALVWNPITSIDYTIQKIQGRSDYFLKMTIISRIVGILVLCITTPLGLYAMCFGQILSILIILPVYAHYTNKAIGYGLKEKISDCGKSFLLSIFMGVSIYMFIQIMPNNLLKLAFGIPVGIIFYIITAKLLKIEELSKIIEIIKQYRIR